MHRFNQFGACPNVPVSPSSPRNRILCVAQAKAAPKGPLVRFGIDLFGSRAHIEFSVEVYQVLVSVGVESLNSGLRWFLMLLIAMQFLSRSTIIKAFRWRRVDRASEAR